jgi:hypothetical protein
MTRARWIIAIAIAVAGISACIIGPKQDDPNALAGTDPPSDAAASDTGDRANADSSPGSLIDGGGGSETATDAKSDGSDARPDGDAASDVATEGG